MYLKIYVYAHPRGSIYDADESMKNVPRVNISVVMCWKFVGGTNVVIVIGERFNASRDSLSI